MDIHKAIEILKSEQKHGIITDMDDWNDAIKLGIEALKRLQHNRRVNNHPDQAKLPGETPPDQTYTTPPSSFKPATPLRRP